MSSKYLTSISADFINKVSMLVFFFIWPFASLYFSFRNFKLDWTKNIFWLFCIFFGLTFVIAGEGGADSGRYARLFVQYAHSEYSLAELINSFYSETSNIVDIASPLITYIVSRLTDNPKALFIVFGSIFGYFYSRNIWYVITKIEGNITWYIILLILTFALLNPIWNINGFRYYTAAQIFLFGSLPFLLEGKGKSLLWSVVSLLFHFSFIYAIAALFLYYFLRNRLILYLFLFIITAVINELDLQIVRSTLSFLPEVFQSKVNSYTNAEYAESIKLAMQEYNWYVPFSGKALGWVSYLLVLSFYFLCGEFISKRKGILALFCFSILLYSFGNISSLIPSGIRFLTVANTFLFAFFIIFISTLTEVRGLNLIKVLSTPLLLFFCIVALRIGMDYFSLVTIIGSPIFAMFYTDTTPLIVDFKNFL